MYLVFNSGKVVAAKCAQCGQVIEAYSVIVTGALAGPSAMSGSDTGLATSVAPCAMASLIRRSGEYREPERDGAWETSTSSTLTPLESTSAFVNFCRPIAPSIGSTASRR